VRIDNASLVDWYEDALGSAQVAWALDAFWAADQARAMLGRDSDKDRVRERAAELTRLTVGSRGRHAMYGLATMSWTALQIGDKLAEMADAIARTIRIT
jgi:hypothetical protein